MSAKYTVVENLGRHWALHGTKPLGAVGVSGIRTYLYPFFTPGGACVLQEQPPDHAHHQGIMVGQDFLNGHNFWAMGHVRYPLNLQHQEKIEHTTDDEDDAGVTIVQRLRWATKDGQAVINEERRTRFEVWDGAHFAEVTSIWIAAFGPVHIGQTKEGGLGMRVHPQLETFWGGTIRSSAGKTGEKGVFDTLADWVEVSGQAEGRPVGIVMMPHPSQKAVPWFVRDYGLHLYTPHRHAPGQIAAGGTLSLRVGFVAYDGKSDGAQADRAWQAYRARA